MRLLTMLIAASFASALPTPAFACSTSVFSSSVRSNEVYLLAVPRGHTAPVRAANPPRYLGPATPRASGSAGDSLLGWVVSVEEVVGSAGERLPSDVADAILVPWGYGPDCRPRPWTAEEPWLTADERGVFSAYLRPRSEWVDGRPVLDVFLAWHQPFPTGDFLRYEARRAFDSEFPWLTVDEYWSLVKALPAAEALDTLPVAAGTSLDRWAEVHPELTRRFPASLILDRPPPAEDPTP